MSALGELINKWVTRDHPEKMPGLEVCIYEASLINGLDWAAEEGATKLAELKQRAALVDEDGCANILSEFSAMRTENDKLRTALDEAREVIEPFAKWLNISDGIGTFGEEPTTGNVIAAIAWLEAHPK
jgi:hypothetical protein